MVGDKRANPTESPANNVFPFVRSTRSPVSLDGLNMNWDNLPNTEDWNVIDDKLFAFSASKFVHQYNKTVKIMKPFEFGDLAQ